MLYKGPTTVLSGVSQERNELGAWVTTIEYTGIQPAITSLAAATLPGPRIQLDNRGAVSKVAFTWGNTTTPGVGNETITERWEIDRENLDKDIMFLPAAVALSTTAKDAIRAWRSDPSGTLNTTVTSGGITTGDVPIMNKIADLVRRGVESVQVSTLVLKRTRTMSALYQTTISLAEQTSFYSTAKLVALTGMPAIVSGVLPTGGPATPADTAWGWLPRQANRGYIGRGLVEEQADWIFAAWSTFLYTLVS